MPKMGKSSLAENRRAGEAKRKKRALKKLKAKDSRLAKGNKKAKQQKTGTVYVVEMGPFFKVGYTNGLVECRVASLQTGSPIQLRVAVEFKHQKAKYLETFIHLMLEDCRTSGEWFMCDLSRIQGAAALADDLGPESKREDWSALSRRHGASREFPLTRVEKNRMKGKIPNQRKRQAEIEFKKWANMNSNHD